jgi:murein L,D-transpeptidase YcbB/YkuD
LYDPSQNTQTMLPKMLIINLLRTVALLILLTTNAVAQSITPDILDRQLAELAAADPEDNADRYAALRKLYQDLDYRFIWDDPVLEEQLVTAVAQSYGDGLVVADYPLPSISSLLADKANSAGDAVVRRDLLLSRSFVTLLRHLYYGKADPSASHVDWNLGDLRKLDDNPQLIADAIRSRNIPALMDIARPQQAFYQRLKNKLAVYRDIEQRGGWEPIPGHQVLSPGMSDPVVPALRRRLALVGDYAPLTEDVGAPYTGVRDADADARYDLGAQSDDLGTQYDDALASAVKQFQRRHLLGADGIIGPDTWSALNISVQQKIAQIRANLERMRWALKGLGGDFLLVDIAGYQLHRIRDNEVLWSSAVQVGKPYRETPVFRSEVRYIEWNPTWTVPPTILKQDVLPAIKRDPDYLARKNMVVLTHRGEPVDAATIDWSRYPQEEFPYLLRQLPGRDNALGTVKFIFPNKHAVYLHDTPSRSLFQQTSRAFSSGCIRVEKPYELAQLLVPEEDALAEADIADILASGETQRQHLKEPFPVVILYWTTKWTEDGGLIFAPDIYQRDASIVLALDQPLPRSGQRAAALVH